MRSPVRELLELGPLPASGDTADDIVRLEAHQGLLDEIEKPVTDEEAIALATLFGPDDYFGLAWTLVHLIESAPGWPLLDQLADDGNEWRALLRSRAERGATP